MSHVTASDSDLERFSALVLREGKRLYRDLPWRGIDDDYAVMVSEVMLQQTQVKRVLDYWPRFTGLFPTIDALASAETSLVLEQWQGLGYNRRAIALKRCAEQCSQQYAGMLPETVEELVALPGIGPATAGGIMAFARNKPCVYLETNVRAVFIHHFFPDGQAVSDKQLIPLIEATCPQDDPRGWYYALLDYGNFLKATMPNPSRRSKHYSKQSAFEGSRRQKRSWLVRYLLGAEQAGVEELEAALNREELAQGRAEVPSDEVHSIIDDLVSEGFFAEADGIIRLG